MKCDGYACANEALPGKKHCSDKCEKDRKIGKMMWAGMCIPPGGHPPGSEPTERPRDGARWDAFGLNQAP